MSAVWLALAAMAGFSGASLVALLGRKLGVAGRASAAAVAAGILLAIAFADLFPEALELAEMGAVAGFMGGFVLLFLAEALGGVHHGHQPRGREGAVEVAPWPLVLGLAVHNLADGFVLGAATGASAGAFGLLGLGILVHQVPVGLSLAAILVTAKVTRAGVIWTTLGLGLVIPLAALSTMALPLAGDGSLGVLTGAAGGVLAYMGAVHLLPETQAGNAGKLSAVLFAGTLVATTFALTMVLGH